MELLSPLVKDKPQPLDDLIVPTVGDAILAIHDVLQHATNGADVIVLCRSLHFILREKLWADVSGSTFGDQLDVAITAGARVRLLLTNEFAAELISARVVALADQYDPDQFDMYSTGKMHFFETFPHFTIVRNASKWFDYVEWKHASTKEPDKLTTADPVDGMLYLGSSKAASFGELLHGHFDILFKKAKSAAPHSQPARVAAASTLTV
jgi:hypothetical protein